MPALHLMAPRQTALLILLVAGLVACTRTDQDPTQDSSRVAANAIDLTDWPGYRGQAQLTGLAGGEIPADLALLWTFKTGDAVVSSPVIVADRVYVGSDDGKVYAISLGDGAQVWATALGAPGQAMVEAPPLVDDGKVYVGDDNGEFWCLAAATGEVLWKFTTDAKVVGSAAVVELGTTRRILVGSHDNLLHCLDVAGVSQWSYETGGYINGSPAVFDSKVVFGGCDGMLHVVSVETGKAVGVWEVGSYVAASAAVAGGRGFVGHHQGQVLCFDLANGEVLWQYGDGEQAFFSSPAVGARRVVIGCRDRRLHCIDRQTGEGLWVFKSRGRVDSSPVICGSRVVVASSDGRLYLLDLEGGEQIWRYEIGAPLVSSPAVARGHIVIGSSDGSIYAFAKQR